LQRNSCRADHFIAPWRNTSASGFDPEGHRGIRWGASMPSKRRKRRTSLVRIRARRKSG
jgi:hypothetical protein